MYPMGYSRAMKKASLPLLIAFLLLAPGVSSAVISEIHIGTDGKFIGKNIAVYQRASSNLFTRAVWDKSFLRITILMNSTTAITKKHGELATLTEINEGDVIDVEGTLTTASEALILNATKIRNVSLEKESKSFSGKIENINASARTFTLPNSLGKTSVSVPTSISITKGKRTISFGELKVGDKVVNAPGIYDYPSNTLTVTALEIYQDTAMFKSKNFEGTLKSLAASTLPTTAVITVAGTDYTVYLNDKASVLNKSRAATSLKRFADGDKVRFYGAIREANFSEIDAEIIRDLNF